MQLFLKVFAGALIGLALAIVVPKPGFAVCQCQCVDGQPQAVCPNSLEIPPLCPASTCPLTTPVNPLAPPVTEPQTVSPNTGERCVDRQVYNPRTGQMEWRRLCS